MYIEKKKLHNCPSSITTMILFSVFLFGDIITITSVFCPGPKRWNQLHLDIQTGSPHKPKTHLFRINLESKFKLTTQ